MEELTQTQVVQPALFAVGMALTELARELGVTPDFVAGHSLGEYTAAAASGALDPEDGMRLVSERGRRMAEIQSERPGRHGRHPRPPRRNARPAVRPGLGGRAWSHWPTSTRPTQTVVSGEEAGVLKMMELSADAGAAKTIKLQVTGAFHSQLMKPVQTALAETMEGLTWSDPQVPLVANHSGQVVTTGDDVRQALIAQIASPVRWVDCVQTLVGEGCDRALELGPGRVLSGLIRKIDPDLETLNADSGGPGVPGRAPPPSP